MTITTKQPQTKVSPATQSSSTGFPTIPTRIRDVREAQVPPLVVEPMAEQDKAAIRQSLAELGIKLAEIHRTAAEAYLSQALYEQSLPHLEAAATFSPSEIEFHMQLGFVRYVTGDDVGAINSFNTVLGSDQNNGEAWFNLGMVLFGQEQFQEAESCFGRATEIEPNDAQTWNNRGVCLWKLQRQADARTCFQQALAARSVRRRRAFQPAKPRLNTAVAERANCRLASGKMARGATRVSRGVCRVGGESPVNDRWRLASRVGGVAIVALVGLICVELTIALSVSHGTLTLVAGAMGAVATAIVMTTTWRRHWLHRVAIVGCSRSLGELLCLRAGTDWCPLLEPTPIAPKIALLFSLLWLALPNGRVG